MADARTSPSHEPDAPQLRALLLAGGALIGLVAAAVLVAFLFVRATLPERATPLTHARVPDGAARLQSAPEDDFPAFHREKQRLLHDYAWVDRAHGTVRIPIERAMALLVEQQARRAEKR